jgi:HTH-type transcriptional regulator, sugar sensing transcriptional regulator
MMRGEENILKQAGLSEEQALVYQSLLEKGPQKASPLSQWTGIKRGLIYKVLEQLEMMNLVEKKGGAGTVAIFYPNHPSNLLDKIERDKKSLELARDIVSTGLGNLSSKYNLLAGKPNVRFFEGEEGIIKVIQDSLESKTEILTFADNEAMNKTYPELNKKNIEMRKNKSIKKRIISIDTPYIRELAKNDQAGITERRVIKSDEQFAVAMQIYDDKVAFITLDPNRSIGIIIEDKSIYEMQKIMFEFIWQGANPIGPNSA